MRSCPTPFLIACTLVLGTATFQVSAQGNPPAAAQQNPPAPNSQTPAGAQQQEGAEKAVRSKSGQAGTQEPSSAVPTTDNTWVFVNGALNVPGAPKDGQTVPAKFSARNAALDKIPILAVSLKLTDEQRQKIIGSVRQGSAPIATLTAEVTAELPRTVEMYDLPPAITSEVPGVSGLKYVRLANKILLVYAPNWIVVGEIETGPAN